MKISVPANSYKVMLLGLLNTFNREDWLLEASEMSEASGLSVADHMRSFIAPRVMQFAHDNNIPKEYEEKLIDRVFMDFTGLAIPE